MSYVKCQFDLSSLDESVVDSSMTESDGEDYLIGLTKSIGGVLASQASQVFYVEVYVLPSQVLQVFYVEDVRHKDWVVVVKTKPREVFDVNINVSHDDDNEVDTYFENVPYNITIDDACDDANDNRT
uniref:DUF4216 domain-containing protein n=1 Tax=Quercus lobata TaxID=97700 RepID=A0A7N2R957_QUELO